MNLSLHERALECVRNFKRSEKELIDVLSELDKTKAYLTFGVSSLFRYCVEKLGLSEAETQRFTQVTRKSDQCPQLKKAINEGLLTVSKASRIVPAMTVANQSEWIQKAVTMTHREIEREVSKVNPKPVRREKIEIRTPERSELRVSISIELETKFRRAQEVLRATSLEETLEKLVDLALKQKDPILKANKALQKKEDRTESNAQNLSVPGPRTERMEVSNSSNVSASLQEKENGNASNLTRASVVQQPPEGIKAPNFSYPTPPSTRQIKPAGRQMRSPIPAKLKHEVYFRDQGRCGFKACGERKWVELHHVLPLSMGGRDEIDNLMLVCWAHHKMMHERKTSDPLSLAT